MTTLGCNESLLDPAQVQAVYDLLSRSPGIVGLAARYAMQKRHLSQDNLAAVSSRPEPRPPAGTVLPFGEICAIFSPCVGNDKAAEIVRVAIRKLHLSEDALGKTEVLALLEDLASAPGLVGVTARFAKARVILRFS